MSLGSILGAAAGYLLAPATGGASLALASAGLGASLGGALDASQAASGQAQAAKEAANTYAASGDRAADVQRQMFERQIELQKPFRQAGEQALNRLVPLATEYTPFGMQQFQADPGYAFRLAEGQKALERSAAARGGLMSGNALRAAQRYGQEMGSQEYQNAFNRYQLEREARLNPLQSLAGVGQTSANVIGQAGQQYGTNIGNIGMSAGEAQGNALLAGAQARSSAYKGIGESFGGFLGSPLAGQLANYYMTPSNTNAYIPMQLGGGY
jgi:hypothetical protein